MLPAMHMPLWSALACPPLCLLLCRRCSPRHVHGVARATSLHVFDRSFMQCRRRRRGRRGAGCGGDQRAARARRLGDLLHPHCVSLARCLVLLGMCRFGSWHSQRFAGNVPGRAVGIHSSWRTACFAAGLQKVCRCCCTCGCTDRAPLFPTCNPYSPCSCPQLPPLPERGCAVCGAAACQCWRRRPGGHF